MKRDRKQKSILGITQTEKIRTMALAQPNQLSLMKPAGKLDPGIADMQLIPSLSTMRTIGNDGTSRLKVSEHETIEYSNPCDSMSVIKYLQNTNITNYLIKNNTVIVQHMREQTMD